MSPHDVGEPEGKRRNEELPDFRRCRVPQFTYHKPLNGAYGSSLLFFFLLRFATYLGTLTLCPHLPSCNARLERQTGLPISRLPQETAPAPTPRFRPRRAPRSPASRATEHAQHFHCCVSPRASRSVWELEAKDGLRRGEGMETPKRPGMGRGDK